MVPSNAECGMEIGLGLELGSGVRVGVMARAWVGSGLGFYCAAVLHNFSQCYALCIAQNGYSIKITLRQ